MKHKGHSKVGANSGVYGVHPSDNHPGGSLKPRELKIRRKFGRAPWEGICPHCGHPQPVEHLGEITCIHCGQDFYLKI